MPKSKLLWKTRNGLSVVSEANGLNLTVARSGIGGFYRFVVATFPEGANVQSIISQGVKTGMMEAMLEAEETAWMSRMVPRL
jgi:hypothetical protein